MKILKMAFEDKVFWKKTLSSNRIRKLGGGRKKVSEKTPALVAEIEKIVAPNSRGAPQSPLQWTCKSTRNISKFFSEKGYKISHTTVADILHELDYSLQGNAGGFS